MSNIITDQDIEHIAEFLEVMNRALDARVKIEKIKGADDLLHIVNSLISFCGNEIILILGKVGFK
jgi:hypothetical protein